MGGGVRGGGGHTMCIATLAHLFGQKVVATGGVASLFEGASQTIDYYDQDITIRGLLEIYRRNS